MTTGPVAALLRGINVGGRSLIPMTGLKDALAEAGLPDVRTYLQSGNLIVPPSPRSPDETAAIIEVAIADRFGKQVRVVTRTGDQMTDICFRNPFAGSGVEPKFQHVVFLEKPPATSQVGGLDPERSPSDRFEVSGCEIYVEYPNGSGRSKLDLAYFEKVLGVAGTARNWNTVAKLAELLTG